jgi:nucleoside-diphosphate-sugar epimerase
VLGGDGFIGSAISRTLSRGGVVVTSIGRPVGARSEERIEETMRAIAASAPNALVHAASPPMIDSDFLWEEERLRLLHISAIGVPTVIIGSAAVLAGSSPDVSGKYSETAVPHPLSTYGHFKFLQEQEAMALRSQGWPVAVVRVFNPLGPKMKSSLMLGKLLQQIVDRERSPELSGDIRMGDLSAYRDFCHVDDAADAIQAILELPALPDLLHIGSGLATLTRDIAEMALTESQRTDLRVIEEQSGSSGPARVISDSSRLHDSTGWQPRRTLHMAVKDALIAERDHDRTRLDVRA